MNIDKKEFLKPVITLLAICLVITLSLSVVNAVTKDKIAELAVRERNDLMRVVLPDAESFKETSDTLFEGSGGGKTVGYVVITTTKGYGGDVSVMTGISSDLSVKGVRILSENETPGLGKKASENSFLTQFLKSLAESFTVVKGTAANGQISAITGATISSKAVTDAVNEALETVRGLS